MSHSQVIFHFVVSHQRFIMRPDQHGSQLKVMRSPGEESRSSFTVQWCQGAVFQTLSFQSMKLLITTVTVYGLTSWIALSPPNLFMELCDSNSEEDATVKTRASAKTTLRDLLILKGKLRYLFYLNLCKIKIRRYALNYKRFYVEIR